MTEKFIGLPYPITKDAGGLFHTQSGVDQIKSDLLILLLTNPGERVMLPNFGTNLRQLIFEPNDAILERQAIDIISTAIQTWEPRISIQQISVTSNPPPDVLNPFDDLTNQENILYIKIDFIDPENIQEVNELVLQVPLPG